MRRVCPIRGKDSQQAEGKGRGGSSFHERDNTEQRAWRGGEERRERGERRGEERRGNDRGEEGRKGERSGKERKDEERDLHFCLCLFAFPLFSVSLFLSL